MSSPEKSPNALIHSNSPYLLQHAWNPVQWQEWGSDALAQADEEQKLIIVSIGYAACHWCHVMEKETFENEEAAALMNAHFVCIKADREERPDIDQIYMDAVMVMNGQGGWPLNVVCLPDGKPVWGGTYFPRARWMNALEQLAALWQEDPPKVKQFAARMMEGLESLAEIPQAENAFTFSPGQLLPALKTWAGSFDRQFGGPDRVPKFPMPGNLLMLMRQAFYSEDQSLYMPVHQTLKHMAIGGIFDQVGGGFCRYSTDRYWLVPHFEKMLYDNAQLVSLYAEAGQFVPDPLWKETVEKTMGFVIREMLSPEGGFYASLDADSEGEEGRFYTWTKDEILSLLGGDGEWYCEMFGVSPEGNWEHKNILHMKDSPAHLAEESGTDIQSWNARAGRCHAQLLEARSRRIRPGLDDKILCSWNALMLKACLDAYRAFGNEEWKAIALRNAAFILAKLKTPQGLLRSYRQGKAQVPAFLDDYALLADAFIRLYEESGEVIWLDEALELCETVLRDFSQPDSALLYFTSAAEKHLIQRKCELNDNVVPSSNAVMAHVLFRLGHILGRTDFEERAAAMLGLMMPQLTRYPSSSSHWGLLWQQFAYPFYECIFTGPDAAQYARDFARSDYHPGRLILFSAQDNAALPPLFRERFIQGKNKVFICRNKVCNLPADTVEEALAQIRI